MNPVTAPRTPARPTAPSGPEIGFRDPALARVWERVVAGERLDRGDGLAILETLWASEQGGLGWSMALAAFRLCNAPADRLADDLAAYVEATRLFDDGVALAWAAIALGDGIDRLRVP